METLLELLELFDNYKPLDEIEELPDVYNNKVKNIIIDIIKHFLNIAENYNFDLNKKALISCFLFNWMLTHKKKLGHFFDNQPKFRSVCFNKLLEFKENRYLEKYPYWKGYQFYIDKLIYNL